MDGARRASGWWANGSGGGWLKEVCTALGVTYPLPEQQPPRHAVLHTVRSRDVHDALWALSDELRSLVRIEAEWDSEGGRKPNRFTLVYRLGDAGNRIERHVSQTLNKALTEANKTAGGGQVLRWRAKTGGRSASEPLSSRSRLKGVREGAVVGKGGARARARVRGKGGKGKAKAPPRGGRS